MGTGVEGRQECGRDLHQPPVNFSEGLLLPNFQCEALRSLHRMEGHDAWTWAGACALVCTVRRALVSEGPCRSLIRDVAALLNALAKECCKNGALNDIMLGQALNDFARKRLQGELALVCSHV